MVDDLIRAIEAAGLSLATKAGIEMWAKGMLRSTFPITIEVDIEVDIEVLEGPLLPRRPL